MVPQSYRHNPRANPCAGRTALGVLIWLSALATGVTTRPAAAIECAPHCDYNHYYGPYDMSSVGVGLYAYPVCGRRGNCAPYLVYGNQGYASPNVIVSYPPRPNITVTFPRRPGPAQR